MGGLGRLRGNLKCCSTSFSLLLEYSLFTLTLARAKKCVERVLLLASFRLVSYIVAEIVISEQENSLEDSDVNTEIDPGDKISRNDKFHHVYYFPERLECSN